MQIHNQLETNYSFYKTYRHKDDLFSNILVGFIGLRYHFVYFCRVLKT